jgi:hypothetical protein
MRQVGTRREQPMSLQPNGILLAQGVLFNAALAHLSGSTFVTKGVYRFKTHALANQHALDCLALGMGRLAAARTAMTTNGT